MTPHPIYPVRIDADGDACTMDGRKLKDIPPDELTAAIVAGFHHATPMRTTEEVLSGTGIKWKRGKAS